jgi:hypothetical protein
MKKFLVLLILAGAVAAGFYFYDPYLKEHVDPLWEKIAGDAPEPVEVDKGPPTPVTPPKPESKKPAPDPKATAAAPKPKTAPAPETQKSEIDLLVEKQYPMPQVQPLLQIVNNWTGVPPRAYPAKVVTKDIIGFSLLGPNGQPIGSSNVAAGNEVKPDRLDGTTLYVSNLANPTMTRKIEVDKTDFKEQIEKRYNDYIALQQKRILEMREMEKKRLTEKPDQLAALKAGKSAWEGEGDPRFGPVKASLAAGEVTAFNLDEAVGFRWNGRERITAGKYAGTYDTVTVKYEARTIFGVFPGEMKCLLDGGRVVGWIDPYTQEERI